MAENQGSPPRPADEDRLDVNQAFADVEFWRSGKDSFRVRAGIPSFHRPFGHELT